MDLWISTPFSSGIAILAGPGTRVGATWAETSSPIGPEWLQVASRRGQDSQVWLVSSALLSELWKVSQTSPDLSQSEGEVYLNDNEYD